MVTVRTLYNKLQVIMIINPTVNKTGMSFDLKCIPIPFSFALQTKCELTVQCYFFRQ